MPIPLLVLAGEAALAGAERFAIRKGVEAGVSALERKVGKRAVNKLESVTKRYTKKITGKDGIEKLSNRLGSGVQKAGNSIKFDLKIDTTEFDRDMREYVKVSKRDNKEIVNQKAFSISLGAYGKTYAVEKAVLKSLLEQSANVGKGLRIGDILAIQAARAKGKKIPKNITALGNKFIRRRVSHVKSIKRSWLPAIRGMAVAVKKNSPNGLAFGDGYGNPETHDTDLAAAVIASVVEITDGKVNDYLQKALQEAFNKEAASMRAYVQKKIDARNKRFSN